MQRGVLEGFYVCLLLLLEEYFFVSLFSFASLKLCYATVKVVSFTAFRGGFRESPNHAAFKA